MDRVGAVIRLLAALVASAVGVPAAIVWGPELVDQHRPGGLADIGQHAVAPPAAAHDAQASLSTEPAASGDTGTRMATATSRGGSTRAADESELSVTIDALTPSAVPDSGPVVVRGRVSNQTDETWAGVNVIPCTSSDPMTTEAELRAAVESDPELQVCGRIAPFAALGDLAPGETRRYVVRIPRDELGIPSVSGVYWFNVQVLGTNTEGRDPVSDGRARSFLPLVEDADTPVPTSIVVPFRRSTLRDADGRLTDVDAWAEDVAPGGRLHSLVEYAAGAGTRPLTLLVDPAILEAVEQLAQGNPVRDLGSPASEDPDASGEGGDGGEADEDDENDGADGAEAEELVAEAVRADAQDWIEDFTRLARAHTVLGLPYGDLDLAAAARYDRSLVDLAFTESARAFEAADIEARPAVVPPSGLLEDSALDFPDDLAPRVLLAEEALPEELLAEGPAPTTILHDDRTVGVFDPTLATGGPGPDHRMAPVALRQRVLAEAAIRAVTGDDRPLLLNLPSDFDPGEKGRVFFTGIERPFLQLAGDVVGSGLGAPEVPELVYPQRQLERELFGSGISAAADLVSSGRVLDRLLVENDTVSDSLTGQALSSASYLQRDDRLSAAASAAAATGWVEARLAQVTITAPSFVILASESGPFAVKVSNGLDQPIRMRIRAFTRDELEIRAQEVIELEANAQQTVNLTARARSAGVHSVTLVATDEELEPLGASEEISVRSNQVGRVIWVVMGVGVGILFLAIAVRLTRRIRRARAS